MFQRSRLSSFQRLALWTTRSMIPGGAKLLPVAARLHLCAVDSPRAEPPERLAALVGELGPTSHAVYPSVREALRAAREEAGPDGCVLCCGSLYLAAEVAAALGGRSPGWMPSERL